VVGQEADMSRQAILVAVGLIGLVLLSAIMPAGAATIAITSDKLGYQTGDQILLTVSGDAEQPSAGPCSAARTTRAR
jgi:hypothetical protein